MEAEIGQTTDSDANERVHEFGLHSFVLSAVCMPEVTITDVRRLDGHLVLNSHSLVNIYGIVHLLIRYEY